MNEIRTQRLEAGLTQSELAALSGVAQPNIAAYETGRRTASPEMIARLRAAASPRPSVVLRKHRDEILALAREHKATNVRVFGSTARGEDGPGSDLDLLVRFNQGASLLDLVALTQAIEELTAIHVDVISEGGLRPGYDRIREEAVAL